MRASPIHVVSDAEAEKASFVVCCRDGMPRYFPDDENGTCSHCGHAIFYRPSVPKTPPKICIMCALEIDWGGRA